MQRDQLDKLNDAELRALAEDKGVGDAAELGRTQLIALILEIAPDDPAGRASPRAPKPPRRPTRGSFDVPSSTVHHPPDEPFQQQPPRATNPPPPSSFGEPLFMLDLEELPETYGVDECEVLYKDPWWVFAYWEVTDGGLDAARAQLGPSAASARLVLRLFSTVQEGGELEREVHDIDLHSQHGRRYLPTVKPGAQLRVAVGLLSAEGYFAPIAHSSLQRIPYADVAPPGPVEWMEVIPARTRGREPLVVVRRSDGQHSERGLDGERFGQLKPPGSSRPGKAQS